MLAARCQRVVVSSGRLLVLGIIKPEAEEDAREKVIVVDLSLRNPLAPGFARSLLNKLVNQPDLKKATKAEPNGDIAWNLRHLAKPL